jgi:hypothetical protein
MTSQGALVRGTASVMPRGRKTCSCMRHSHGREAWPRVRVSSRIHEASPAPHRSAPFLVVPPSAVAVLVPSIRAPYAAPCRVTRRECALLLASATRFEPGGRGFELLSARQSFRGLAAARQNDPHHGI